MSTAASPDQTRRTRIEVRLEAADLHWAEGESGPEGSFYSIGHAMESALTRLEDEFNFLAGQCRARRLKFDSQTFWRIYEDPIRDSTPRRAGRPSATDKSDRRRAIGHVSTKALKWIGTQTQPAGPFSPESTAAHAVAVGLRALKACQVESPVRSNRFPFDGEALLDRYVQLRKQRA